MCFTGCYQKFAVFLQRTATNQGTLKSVKIVVPQNFCFMVCKYMHLINKRFKSTIYPSQTAKKLIINKTFRPLYLKGGGTPQLTPPCTRDETTKLKYLFGNISATQYG